MPVSKKRRGILGGAFDPIHRGHIQVAQHCLDKYSLDQIRFVPSKQPILKQACAAHPWQRAAMIALAIANNDKFYLDTRELLREQPSYALLTLKSLRKEYPQDDFFWILGEDAFADFHHWHQWQEIASLCHLLVVSRQHHTPIHSEVKAEIEFCFKAAGHEVLYLPMPLCPTASRTLRPTPAQLQAEVPEAVWHFIAENEVYTHRSSNAG